MQMFPFFLSDKAARARSIFPVKREVLRRHAGVWCSVMAGAVALTMVCACSKPPEATPSPTPTPEPATPPPTPTPKGTPTPTPLPTPTPIVRHFAPEGVFFITEEVTVRGPGFIAGVPPGTKVKMVTQKGETATVNDGSHDFEVKTSQLTNDLDELAKIRRSAAASEQAGDAFRQQQDAAYQRQQAAQIEYLRTHPLGGNTTPTPTPARRR